VDKTAAERHSEKVSKRAAAEERPLQEDMAAGAGSRACPPDKRREDRHSAEERDKRLREALDKRVVGNLRREGITVRIRKRVRKGADAIDWPWSSTGRSKICHRKSMVSFEGKPISGLNNKWRLENFT
jgi:hypothetical protein